MFSLLQFQGCYTVIQKTESGDTDRPSAGTNFNEIENDESLIEGTVAYLDGSGGGTMEIFYPAGFILKDYLWVFNNPNYSAQVLYLIGSIDKSYINRRVKIVGKYQIPRKNPNSAPDYSSKLFFTITRIKILY